MLYFRALLDLRLYWEKVDFLAPSSETFGTGHGSKGSEKVVDFFQKTAIKRNWRRSVQRLLYKQCLSQLRLSAITTLFRL